jgi:hypothetical protein
MKDHQLFVFAVMLGGAGLVIAIVPARAAAAERRRLGAWQDKLSEHQQRVDQLADAVTARAEALEGIRRELVDSGYPTDTLVVFERAYELGRQRGRDLAYVELEQAAMAAPDEVRR